MLCQTAVGRALQDTVRLRLGTVSDCEPAAVAGQAVNRHSWSLPSATACLLKCTVKEILRDKHMQLRITAFLLLLMFPSESNYDQVYKSPFLATRLLSYPGTGRYTDDRKFCLSRLLRCCLFSKPFFKEPGLAATKTYIAKVASLLQHKEENVSPSCLKFSCIPPQVFFSITDLTRPQGCFLYFTSAETLANRTQ